MKGIRVLHASYVMCLAAAFTVAASVAQAKSSDDDGTAGAIIILGIILLAIFALPTIVAFYRGHPNRWVILLINAVFGATVIGWFGSLIWALNGFHRPMEGSAGGQSGLNLFVNDERTVRIAGQVEAKVTAEDPVEQLSKLKTLHDAGAISAEEYAALKRKILSGIVGT